MYYPEPIFNDTPKYLSNYFEVTGYTSNYHTNLKYMINNIFTGSEGEIVCDLFEINKDCYFLIKADIDWDLNWDDEINDSFKVFRDDCYDVIKKWLSIIDHAKCKIDIDNNEQLVINLTKTHKWIEQTIYNEL